MSSIHRSNSSEDVFQMHYPSSQETTPKKQISQTFSARILEAADPLMFLTLLAVSAMGVLGFVGGQVLGYTIMGAGSLFLLNGCTGRPLSITLVGLTIINSIGLLPLAGVISARVAGGIICTSVAYLISRVK